MGLLGILLKSGREEIWACKIIAHPACERPTREAAGSGRLPDIHSLREVNALSTFSTIGFAGTTTDVTRKKIDRKSNTAREPAKKNVYKDVSAAYAVIVLSYWQLAFTGYWAFGS
ncbi:hypothetical protein DVH24_010672 [Malus domestica]|uniref:Uncharacterized protein n=1 Tax=Malus domestica TaxID=3750 RepID=A0A498JTT2_MALDO|nr:hypothetical protein DVH24_010672 [Malus domestica]